MISRELQLVAPLSLFGI